MTYRELELYIEGQDDWRGWIRELMAWVQANLINIQIPRGKPKVKVQQLLPKKDRRRHVSDDDRDTVREIEAATAPLEATAGDPQARVEAAKARAKARQEQAEWETFLQTAEGQRVAELMGYDDEG